MSQTILCYGDSNTWGCTPLLIENNAVIKDRFPRHIRWPGRLQTLLGPDYYVIEEGLNSRTTNVDYHVPPDRNGKTYLAPCLYSHAPIDLVILALGGNDMKAYFNRTPEDVTAGLSELVDMIQTSTYGPGLKSAPKVLIVSVPIPLPVAEQSVDEQGVRVFAEGVEKATKLTGLFRKLAEDKGCGFLDISTKVIPSAIDGVHFDEVGHETMAKLVSSLLG